MPMLLVNSRESCAKLCHSGLNKFSLLLPLQGLKRGRLLLVSFGSHIDHLAPEFDCWWSGSFSLIKCPKGTWNGRVHLLPHSCFSSILSFSKPADFDIGAEQIAQFLGSILSKPSAFSLSMQAVK